MTKPQRQTSSYSLGELFEFLARTVSMVKEGELTLSITEYQSIAAVGWRVVRALGDEQEDQVFRVLLGIVEGDTFGDEGSEDHLDIAED